MASATQTNAMTDALETDILNRYLLTGVATITNGSSDTIELRLITTASADENGSGTDLSINQAGSSNNTGVAFTVTESSDTVSATNDAAITIEADENIDVLGFYLMDGSTKLFYANFASAISVLDGDKIEFAASSITITLN